MAKSNRIVMITGATSGIGNACAHKFALEGDHLIITGRKADVLNEQRLLLQKQYGIEVLSLCFDVRNRKAVQVALERLETKWQKIDVLINNAGLAAGLDTIQDGDCDDWDAMLDTNVKGLLYVSKHVMPLMINNGKGHIINIGSIAGREVYARGNVYCATKHAVDAISQGMRIDLLPYGIKVTQIAPAAVETNFSVVRFKGDEEKAQHVYDGFEPLKGEDIAEACWYVTTLPRHVNINDMLIAPTAQASAAIFHKVLD